MDHPSIAIIADDLTGLCDTGAQFASAGFRTTGFVTQEFDPDQIPQVLIVNTQSRSMEPATASGLVKQVAARLRRIEPTWFFKKIDTALRGNIRAEVLSIMETLGMRMALFVGAIPQAGRTTRGGRQFFREIPITDSILGRDELNPNPVFTSRIGDLFEEQTDLELEHVGLDQIRSGKLQIPSPQESRLKKIFIFDAGTDGDIDQIVKASMRLDPASFFYIGALGLASGLARSLVALPSFHPRSDGESGEALHGIRTDRVLMVSGSPHPTTQGQIAHLKNLKIVKAIELESEDILERLDDCAGRAKRACQTGLKEGGKVLIHIGIAKPKKEQGSGRLAVALAQLVGCLLSGDEVDSLVLVGGETAFAICQAVGIRSIEIHGTISSVAAYGRPEGSLKQIKVLVTKGGSLGEVDILERIIRFLGRESPRLGRVGI